MVPKRKPGSQWLVFLSVAIASRMRSNRGEKDPCNAGGDCDLAGSSLRGPHALPHGICRNSNDGRRLRIAARGPSTLWRLRIREDATTLRMTDWLECAGGYASRLTAVPTRFSTAATSSLVAGTSIP